MRSIPKENDRNSSRKQYCTVQQHAHTYVIHRLQELAGAFRAKDVDGYVSLLVPLLPGCTDDTQHTWQAQQSIWGLPADHNPVQLHMHTYTHRGNQSQNGGGTAGRTARKTMSDGTQQGCRE